MIKEFTAGVKTNPENIRNWYSRVSKTFCYESISDIWRNNINTILRPIIYSDESFNRKLEKVLKTILFSLQPETSIIDHQLSWHISLFKCNGMDIFELPQEFCAHDVESNEYTRIINNRRLSPDFVLRLHYLNEIKKYFPLANKRMTFAELGAGYGGLTRVIKLAFSNSTCIIFDLPETLYFCASFLTHAFPELNSLFVEENTQVKDLGDFDFVFVPTGMEHKFRGITIDLFMNTRSLGEMPNSIIEQWFRFIQNETTVNYVFMLNRFMNPLLQKHRVSENEASLLYDRYWKILRWEFEPDFERCPYNEMTAFPNLLVIVQRQAMIAQYEAFCKKESKEILERVKKQDWFQIANSKGFKAGGFLSNLFSMICFAIIRFLPQKLIVLIKKATYWRSKTVQPAHIYNISGRMLAHPIVSGRIVDFTKNGTLFDLWESVRLDPNVENVGIMIKYFEYLSVGRFQQYEEYYYYKSLWKKLTDKSS